MLRSDSPLRALGPVLLALAAHLAAADNPYAGAAACSPCHPKQAQTQAISHHAKALQRAENSQLPSLLIPQPVRERNGTSFEYESAPGGLKVVASQGERKATGLIEWVFGAGALALTPVGRDDDGYFEHRVSWYSASERPGMTLGHSTERPRSPQAALGRRPKADEIARCFGCHASVAGPDLQWMEPGVRCERCHSPGRSHVQTPTKTNISANRATNPRAQVAFCAQCHRAPDETLGAAPEQTDPMLVRFAPIGLTLSRCFKESGQLTCLTCHNPHEDTSHQTAFYSEKCLSCHEGAKPAAACAFTRNDCLSCHMPKRMPVKDLTFTDHRIRVVQRDR